MNNITLLDKKYELIKNEKEAFNLTDIDKIITDYFIEYDYILGDYSYGKLRLKGFNDEKSKNKNQYNDFNTINDYIKTYCAYECKHFILRKID